MMYPRLVLLRKLLADDGAIFISIDDNELYNLKLVCDEIFRRVVLHRRHLVAENIFNEERLERRGKRGGARSRIRQEAELEPE